MARYLMTHSLLSSWLYAMKENPYAPPPAGRSGPPAGGYPPSNYGGGDFTELGDDDDGELPF